jgi:GIY-YIG catalytic domain/NUMOD3 motif
MIKFHDCVDKNSEVFIYWLENPITEQVFYIGKTQNPEQRFRYHSRSYDDPSKNPKLRAVIRGIVDSGLTPLMTVIDGCKEVDWKKLERYWICKCAFDWQLPLCNISLGGGAVDMTDEVREKISLRLKGKILSEETKQKMRGRKAWNKGVISESGFAIEQIDSIGNVVSGFPSIKRACEALGLNRGNMSAVVSGRKKSIKGYYFRRAI